MLACFHPPHGAVAIQPGRPTGPCGSARRLSRLPPGYPVQGNLLELFPRSVWEVRLPRGPVEGRTLTFLVVAAGRSGTRPVRSEVSVSP